MNHKNYQRSPAELFEELKTAEDRSKHLRANLSYGVITILQLAFNQRIRLDVPEGEPPYVEDKNPPDRTLRRYDNAVKELGHCTIQTKIPSFRKEQIFISVLESVSAQDAKIIIAAKDKKLSELYPFLTEEFIKKTLPEILK